MTKKVTYLILILFLVITKLNAQWSDPKTDTLGFGHDLVGLAGWDENNWIAAGGNSSVFRTTDGWKTFNRVTTNIFTSVRTANAGNANYASIYTSPERWESNNKGSSWAIGSGSNIQWLQMFDSLYGIGTVDCGVFRTTNGGRGWSNIGSVCSNNNAMFGISFPSKAVGYICGNNSVFAKTVDSGATWTSMATNAGFLYSGVAYDVFFVNENVGYISRGVNTNGGYLKKTTNGGASWTDISSGFQTAAGSSNKNMRLYFLDANTGYVTYGAKIYKTTDGGVTWKLEHTHARLDPSVYSYSNIQRQGNLLVFSGDGAMVTTLRLGSSSGINTGISKPEISIIPNPAKTTAYISSNDNIATISLFDVLGNKIKTFQGDLQRKVAIDLNGIPQGVYFVSITDASNIVTQTKLVIQN